MKEKNMKPSAMGTALSMTILVAAIAEAQQPPAPCHPNPLAALDMAIVRNRGDIRNLPDPLVDRLVRQARRPHSQLPTQAHPAAHFRTPPLKPQPSQPL